ncbi:MAG: hypothetical protein K8R53_16430 [Bacteroidales bacterium]|nr:hypothetical protein [Bacteroidales bacterium]
MKNTVKITAILVCLIIFPLFINAQPLPYDLAVGGGEANNPVGGGAPIGGGLILMMMMAIGYGIRKFFNNIKRSR